MEHQVKAKHISGGTLFKILFIGYVFSAILVAIVIAILFASMLFFTAFEEMALFSQVIKEAPQGLAAMLIMVLTTLIWFVIFVPFYALVSTIAAWVPVYIGMRIFAKYKPITIRYIATEEPRQNPSH